MKIFNKAMDPISSETHFIGAILSLVTLLVMVVISIIEQAALLTKVGIIVFGLSSVALYSASALYHYYRGNQDNKIKLFLRKMDHAMIYVLIAGTYTPVCLTYLQYPHSIYFLLVIWSIALLGIVIKLFWMQAPRFLSTIFYLLMGWAVIFDWNAFANVPFGCFALIACGGISYTIGAIIYIIKKPNWFKSFGFHELFHIFVMIGSAFHFIAVIAYMLF
ncbi:hemolysin III family protein [Thomasclavelia sp.]|uniref:PAQR family membrane homeostasis protein TrhA n=1 Tax=Thomasclavelia sp. TaxID=3025757 RepID=UPI0025D27C30|nr:hemolysin III family protein [Thomasclavelia sp.]